MPDREQFWLDLATRVADGAAIDWEAEERGACTDEERRIVDHMRRVACISAAHRRQDPPPRGEEAAPTLDPHEAASQAVQETLSVEAPDSRTSWGSLEIREKIGEGAFGEVFRAWDPKLGREVALKLLKMPASGPTRVADAVLKEGRLMARVRHPNVVTVFGAETHDGRVGFWMEFIRGRSLDRLLQEQGRLGAREAALIGLDLCRALAAVHAAGLVHQDIKASNVLREEGGRIVLMDFGLGRDLGDLGARNDRSISGSPLYMAPEVYAGMGATFLSDIYSLGLLIYHLVTGSYPVKGASFEEIRLKHQRRETKLLRDARPDLPDAFVRVVEKALDYEPERRFATAGQMEQGLSAALGVEAGPVAAAPGGRPRRSLRPAGILSLGMITILGAVLAWQFIGTRSREEPVTISTGTVAGASPDQAAAPGLEPAAIQATPTPRSPTVAAPATTTRSSPIAAPGAGSLRADQVPRTPEKPGAALQVTMAGSPSSVSTAYEVQAAVYHEAADGTRARLESGARLAPGDRLSLEFQASRPLHVYVIDEDDLGNAYALFPIPGLDLQNPLAPDQRHLLPGSIGGEPKSWLVTSAGGREHLLVLASPERLVEFEADMNTLPRPREGELAMPIPESARIRLRGIGGLARAPKTADPGSAGRLFQMADRLASGSERVEGVWVRHLELENP